MARVKRIWREWQHPRDDRGRFSRKGGEAWAKRAAVQFAEHADKRPRILSAPGRPRIGAKAKAAVIIAEHLGHKNVARTKPKAPEIPGATMRTHKEIRDSPHMLQVHHEGGWHKVVGHGYGNGTDHVLLAGDDGERVRVPLAEGKTLPTRLYKQEFHEPLRPKQAARMAQWKADAARKPPMRQRTQREEDVDSARREVAFFEESVALAKRRARARATRKYPAKEGYPKLTRDDYVKYYDRELNQAEHDLFLAKSRLEHVEKMPLDAHATKPGYGLPELTGPLDESRPLAVYGDMLNIEDEDQGTYRHLQDLATLPAGLHALVARYMFNSRARREHYAAGGPDPGAKAGIFVGSKPISQLDESQDLGTTQPRGWGDGDTFDLVDGGYRPSSRTLLVGVSEKSQHRGENHQPALHEFGHALDRAVGAELGGAFTGEASESPEWRKLHAEAVAASPNMSPYFKQAGDAGPNEMWAEGFQAWARARARSRAEGPDGAPSGRAGMFALILALKIDSNRKDIAERMSKYFEDITKRLGVDL